MSRITVWGESGAKRVDGGRPNPLNPPNQKITRVDMVTLSIGEIVLTIDKGVLFVSYSDGEGMEIPMSNLEHLLKQYLSDNF